MLSDNRVVIALDFNNETDVLALVKKLDASQCRLKVGKELFTYCGPQLVRKLTDRGFDVFLDLKFHDIPNTVAKAVSAAADLGVWMVNVHVSGGVEMMRRATEAISGHKNRPLLIGVTVLTSTSQDDLDQLGIDGEIPQRVLNYARLAKTAGLDGVVCSAQEAPIIRSELGDDFVLVTPGIRPTGSSADDQHRIVTPGDAIKDGSSYLVVGRPITKSDNPVSSLEKINTEVELALRGC